MHVRQMTVVEDGTLAQMKRCLLNLPSLILPLMGTYVMPGWDRSFQRGMDADVVIGLTGTVCYPQTEMVMLRNRVRGQTEHAIVLDDANFRLETP